MLATRQLFLFFAGKTEFGISTEGFWFMPHKETIYRGWEIKNGFGAGIGVYASRDLFWRVSSEIGIAYRFKQMQQHYLVDSGSIDPDSGYPISAEGWDKLPMHYVVVPVHFKMLLSKSFLSKGVLKLPG